MSKYIVIAIITAGYFSQLVAGSCMELIDTITVQESSEENGQDGAEQEITFEHDISTISLAGVGFGFLDYPGFPQVSYELYLSRLWEIWSYGALRAGADLITDFDQALLFNVSAGLDLYPFRFGTTPYAGAEAGAAYIQSPAQTEWSLFFALEAGVFAITISDFMLALSARGFLLSNVSANSTGAVLRIGFFF